MSNRNSNRIVLEMHNEKPEKCTEAIKEPSNKSAVGSAKIADSVADSRKIEKMKTAMQEMFDELYAHSYTIPIGLLAKCEELIGKEKEQMKESFEEGICSKSSGSDFEYYYSVTYGNPDQV